MLHLYYASDSYDSDSKRVHLYYFFDSRECGPPLVPFKKESVVNSICICFSSTHLGAHIVALFAAGFRAFRTPRTSGSYSGGSGNSGNSGNSGSRTC